MSFDAASYIMGKSRSHERIVLEDGDYTFSDDGEGNVTIEKSEEGELDNGDETA